MFNNDSFAWMIIRDSFILVGGLVLVGAVTIGLGLTMIFGVIHILEKFIY